MGMAGGNQGGGGGGGGGRGPKMQQGQPSGGKGGGMGGGRGGGNNQQSPYGQPGGGKATPFQPQGQPGGGKSSTGAPVGIGDFFGSTGGYPGMSPYGQPGGGKGPNNFAPRDIGVGGNPFQPMVNPGPGNMTQYPMQPQVQQAYPGSNPQLLNAYAQMQAQQSYAPQLLQQAAGQLGAQPQVAPAPQTQAEYEQQVRNQLLAAQAATGGAPPQQLFTGGLTPEQAQIQQQVFNQLFPPQPAPALTQAPVAPPMSDKDLRKMAQSQPIVQEDKRMQAMRGLQQLATQRRGR